MRHDGLSMPTGDRHIRYLFHPRWGLKTISQKKVGYLSIMSAGGRDPELSVHADLFKFEYRRLHFRWVNRNRQVVRMRSAAWTSFGSMLPFALTGPFAPESASSSIAASGPGTHRDGAVTVPSVKGKKLRSIDMIRGKGGIRLSHEGAISAQASPPQKHRSRVAAQNASHL